MNGSTIQQCAECGRAIPEGAAECLALTCATAGPNNVPKRRLSNAEELGEPGRSAFPRLATKAELSRHGKDNRLAKAYADGLESALRKRLADELVGGGAAAARTISATIGAVVEDVARDRRQDGDDDFEIVDAAFESPTMTEARLRDQAAQIGDAIIDMISQAASNAFVDVESGDD